MKTSRHLAATSFSIALLLSLPRHAHAVNQTYFGGDNGNWSTAANWSPSGLPGAGDRVTLGTHSAGTANLHVNYNYSSLEQLYSVTLDSTALAGSMIVNQTSASSQLVTGYLTIGSTVPGNTWNQSAGGVTAFVLTLGQKFSSGSNNIYNLSGTGSFAGSLYIGDSGGGTFNQTGGSVTVFTDNLGGGLNLGASAGAVGVYNFSAGTIDATNSAVYVGTRGIGTYNQTGGDNQSGEFYLGVYGGQGTANMSGGTLRAEYGFTLGENPNSHVGTGSATFNLSGGTAVGFVVVGKNGTFNLMTGGTLFPLVINNYKGITVQENGLFSMQGGTVTGSPELQMLGGEFRLGAHNVTLTGISGTGGSILSNSASAIDVVSVGTITLDGSNNYSFGGNIGNSTSGYGLVGLTKTGSGTQTFTGVNTYTGPTLLSAGTLAAGSNGAFSANSAYTLASGTTLSVGSFNVLTGSLAGSGGAVNLTGTGSLGTGYNSYSTTYGGTFGGTGSLTKAGSGELTLTGGGGFLGNFDVVGGSLRAGAANGIPTGTSVSLSGANTALNIAANQTLVGFSGGSSASLNVSNNSTFIVSYSQDSSFLGTMAGSGEFRKLGTSSFTLGFGANDFTAAMTAGSLLQFTAFQGTTFLNKATGTTAIGGPLVIDGAGTVVLNRANQIADSSPVTIYAGTLDLKGHDETFGTLSGTGGTIKNGGALTVVQGANKNYNGALTGGGVFIKDGSSALTLTNVGSYGGSFVANTGFLYLQGPVDALGASASNGGVLNFSGGPANLHNLFITSDPGGFVQYFGATINNAVLSGTGPQVIVGNGQPTTTFNSVISSKGALLNQNGDAAFNTFTNGGTFNNNATATINDGFNNATGVMNVKSTLATTDFSTGGQITVYNGGTINNSGSNFAAASGSRTTINAGGKFSAGSGTSIELNGGLLVNNGTQTGRLNVNSGGVAKGTGSFGTVTVNDGGHFGVNAAVPGGTNSTLMGIHWAGSDPAAMVGPETGTTPATATARTLTLGSGSFFAFDLQNAQGAAGVGYDQVHVTGMLTLTANTKVSEQITISLTSLAADGTNGLAANFNPMQNYQFIMIHADSGIMGYTPAEFAVDASGFANALQGGQFSVLQNGNDLVLAYNAVPEPGTWALLGFGGGFVFLCMRTRAARARRSVIVH